jgi:outer membrane receptor for Fe3+-dicitrate
MIKGALKVGVYANIKMNFSELQYFNYDKKVTSVRMNYNVFKKCNLGHRYSGTQSQAHYCCGQQRLTKPSEINELI